uniref:Histone PARylation factor 1 n=1 Tax=Nothoprocta perdicaria TaxID=30464 RepID=A0A8C6YUD1_NOTPE
NMTGGGKRRPRGGDCEKNGDVKKRRSNQADIPDHLRQEAEACYQLRLPEDFYQFWKFCEELDSENPSGMCQMNFQYGLVQMKLGRTV